MLLRYGLLGVACSILFWIAIASLVAQLLVAIWPVVLVVLVLVATFVVWRKRQKRLRR
jgi:Flp pilus assembly protein TadB